MTLHYGNFLIFSFESLRFSSWVLLGIVGTYQWWRWDGDDGGYDADAAPKNRTVPLIICCWKYIVI